MWMSLRRCFRTRPEALTLSMLSALSRAEVKEVSHPVRLTHVTYQLSCYRCWWMLSSKQVLSGSRCATLQSRLQFLYSGPAERERARLPDIWAISSGATHGWQMWEICCSLAARGPDTSPSAPPLHLQRELWKRRALEPGVQEMKKRRQRIKEMAPSCGKCFTLSPHVGWGVHTSVRQIQRVQRWIFLSPLAAIGERVQLPQGLKSLVYLSLKEVRHLFNWLMLSQGSRAQILNFSSILILWHLHTVYSPILSYEGTFVQLITYF